MSKELGRRAKVIEDYEATMKAANQKLLELEKAVTSKPAQKVPDAK
jgi:hypothetical protein